MLVVTRRIDEVVVITVPGRLLKSGQPMHMRVMVTNAAFHKAKLGFDAPADVRVDREEVAIARDRELADGRLGP